MIAGVRIVYAYKTDYNQFLPENMKLLLLFAFIFALGEMFRSVEFFFQYIAIVTAGFVEVLNGSEDPLLTLGRIKKTSPVPKLL